MHSKWVFNHFRTLPRHHMRLLVLLWLSGLLTGILLCCVCADDLCESSRAAMDASVSPFWLLFICILPIAAAIASVTTPLFVIGYPLVFVFAFFHGFSGIMISVGVTGGTWLLRPMILFSSCCTAVLMWWLLLRGKSGICLKKDIRLACIILCFVFLADLFIMSPFVGDLLKSI